MLTIYIVTVLIGWSVSGLLLYLQDNVTVGDILSAVGVGLIPVINIGVACSMLIFISNQTSVMDKVVFRGKK